VPQISYKALIKILKQNGCVLLRDGKGSHEIWFSKITNRNFVVSKTIKASGTYYAVLKQAGIQKN
jgi:predicted RNA binding protein YcfA (HicA-like mRNA interferase family)